LTKLARDYLLQKEDIFLLEAVSACLVKSVLNNLPVYFLSMFPIPKKIATKIERQIRSFLWSGEEEGRKICNVKWASVILPKSQGGLGIGWILAKNKDFFFFFSFSCGDQK